MINLGIVKPGSTIRIPFSTFTSDDPQASATVTSFAAADIEVYKDGSIIQRASDSGFTVSVDFDTTTGVQVVALDLSDNTTAGFYSSGSEYLVIAGPFTLDSATINIPIARFYIGYYDAVINTTIATLSSQTSFTLTSGPAEDDALNGCPVIIHDVASAVQLGHAVISDYVGSTKTVTLTAGTTFTAAATDNIAIYPPSNTQWITSTAQTANDNGADINTLLTRIVGTLAAGTHNAQSGDAYARLGAPAGASVSADIATAQADLDTITGADGAIIASGTQTFNMTGNITGNLSGSVGSVTGNVGGNVTGSVGSVTGNINTAAGTIQTLDGLDTAQDTQHSTTQSNIAALNDLSAAQVNAEVVDALATDTYAEPGQGAPAATTSIVAKINYLYKAWRNKSTQTSTTYSLYDDAGTTVDQKATVSDDATTATKGEVGTGP